MNNKFITFLGLPGSGKSTTSKELANLFNTEYVYNEPEENDWSSLVTNREFYGYENGLLWFRNTRVKQLLDAQKKYMNGENVIVDSYYDKAVYDYIGKPGMEWLLPKEAPYFAAMKELSKTDWQNLPNATHLVILEISKDNWFSFLNSRNRELDNNLQLLQSYDTQQYFIEAAEKLAKEFGISLIRQKQVYSSPMETAKNIFKKIKKTEYNLISK